MRKKKEKIVYKLNVAALLVNIKNTSLFKNVVGEGSLYRKIGSFISR